MTASGFPGVPNLDREVLREAIQEEYEAVACEPQRGFHFHTGRPLAEVLGYQAEWLDGLSEGTIESFAGTGNRSIWEGWPPESGSWTSAVAPVSTPSSPQGWSARRGR